MGLVLLLWFAGWGPGTFYAIESLFGHHHEETRSQLEWIERLLTLLARATAVILASLATTRVVAPNAIRPTRDVRRPLSVGTAALRFITVGFAAQMATESIFGIPHYTGTSVDHSAAALLYDAVDRFRAGPMEEVFFCLACLTLLRQAGMRWWSVALICLALRLTFHLYYGLLPAVALVLVWGMLIGLLYAIQG